MNQKKTCDCKRQWLENGSWPKEARKGISVQVFWHSTQNILVKARNSIYMFYVAIWVVIPSIVDSGIKTRTVLEKDTCCSEYCSIRRIFFVIEISDSIEVRSEVRSNLYASSTADDCRFECCILSTFLVESFWLKMSPLADSSCS